MKRGRALRGIIVGSVMLAMGGCAGHQVWVNPDADQRQFSMDAGECQRQARIATYTPAQVRYYRTAGEAIAAGLIEGFSNGMAAQGIYDSCMQSKGYTKESQ